MSWTPDSASSDRRITPWVVRLLAINAVLLLLQETIFTSDVLKDLERFDPNLAFQRPWTFVTYMFAHANLLHLLGNSLALFVFGPPVERRLGSPTFIAFYLYCGIGAAAFAKLLSVFMLIVPFVGASGAILGVAVAFARLYPDAELMVFPLPAPMKAMRLVLLLVALDVIGAILGMDNIAHVAHLGGAGAGWLFFAMQGLNRPNKLPPMRPTRRRIPVPARGKESSSDRAVAPSPEAPVQTASPPEPQPNAETAEIDRVLDKISATGITSLTPDERRFLDSVARRRRDHTN